MALFHNSGLATLLSALLLVSPISRVRADVEFPSRAGGHEELFHAGGYGPKPNQSYHSTDLISPLFFINVFEKDRIDDSPHILISPAVPGQRRTPMVFDARDLSLVYANPELGGSNPQLQEVNGKETFTFWIGEDMKGWGSGSGVSMDGNFQVVHNVTTVDLGTGADNHEFQLTHDGGAMLNNYHTIRHDLRPAGGPEDGILQDCSFQEVDLETNEVRFTWHGSDHFDVSESFANFYQTEVGWDWFHMNSLFKTLDGHYLISARHLRMIALINGTDGSPIWQVGGKNNSFKDLSDGRATNIGFQHHARFIDPSFTLADSKTQISLFDNQGMYPVPSLPGCEGVCSRGLRLELDLDAMTARVVREYPHPDGVLAWAQGGHHTLPSGHSLINWGTVPGITEYDANGEVVMDVLFGPWTEEGDHGVTSYRIYKTTWVAQPPWNPDVALVDGYLYVSWNGATEVVSWSMVSISPLTGGLSHSWFSLLDSLPS